MKPTPRTDAEYASLRRTGTGTWDIAEGLADFARDLERQLSDALEREKALRQELERVRADEREACARLIEQRGEAYVSKWANADDDMETQSKAYAWEAKQHAIAIRARKEKE